MIVFPIKIIDREYVAGSGYFTKFWTIIDSRKVDVCDCDSKENADFVEKALNIYNNILRGGYSNV